MVFRALGLVVALLVVLASCSSCAPRLVAGDVPSQMDPAVAKLVHVIDGEIGGYCTVFKVGTDLAMTAGHCCGGKTEVEQKHAYHALGPHAIPGAEFEVIYDDDKHDVCIMRGVMYGAPLALATHDPAIGARVWTAGYPKGDLLFSDGLWSGRDEDDEGKASLVVWGGASGSPVMDSDGRVIGVLRAFYYPMSNFAIIAPIEWLRVGMVAARAK